MVEMAVLIAALVGLAAVFTILATITVMIVVVRIARKIDNRGT